MRPKSTKPLLFLLSLLILLQGCVAYKKTTMSLEEIAHEKVRAKVVTRDGKTYRFRYITVKDSAYHGVKSISNNIVNIRLNESEIEAAYPINKTLSTVWPFIGGAVFFTVSAISLNNSCCWY